VHPSLAFAAAALAAPLFVVTALHLGHDPAAHRAAAGLVHRNGGYVGAATCRTCHPDQHASWARTHHATMTQRPSPSTVLGEFDGRTVRYEGRQGRPFRDGERFVMEVPTSGVEGRGHRTAEVALAVGSRRYQQYFERQPRGDSFAFVRLPLLWHVEQRRWLHINTVFLGPDDPDWSSHAATWNENCIFCHNTAPEPRARATVGRAGEAAQFDSEVADLGIACESCHGPGGEHAEARRNPLARYGPEPGAKAVDPARLDPARSISVCGQCHGARLPNPPERAAEWFRTGPTYRPGDLLLDHVTPIQRDTPPLGGDPEQNQLRFWGDGTARLSAYELQGVLASPCHPKGGMTCLHCHTMHAGDPHGQLRPDLPGDRLCTQCHEAIARDVQKHTHHDPARSGASCLDCHMPRVVYGVLEIHRSHRVENPDPARDAAAGRPNACTLCHTDQTLTWAAAKLGEWWGPKYRTVERRADGAPLELPDAIASLHAGDAAVRAVYAAALGRDTAAVDPAATAAQRAHLAVAMGDGYPSVRWLAQRSLQRLEARAPLGIDLLLRVLDWQAGTEDRRRAVFTTLDAIAKAGPGRLGPPPSTALLGADLRLDLPAVVKLTDLQGRNLISIGE